MVSKLFFGVLIAASTVFAADVTTTAKSPGNSPGSSNNPAATVTGTAPAPAAGQIIGTVDLRPSYKSNKGSFGTENFGQIGYRFGGGNSVYYRQEFNTNLYNPSGSQGMNGQLMSGSLRAKVNNIWQDKETGTSLHWEPRLYAPTDSLKRDAGMITQVRNYIKLKQTLSRTAYIQLSDSPILHVYSRKGATVLGKLTANPFIENRVLLEVEVELFLKGLSLYIPLELQSTHFHSFGGAANNARWAHALSFWPELTYPVAKTVRVGIAFRSDNLIKPDFSGTTISDSLKLGVGQIILNASL